MPRVTLPTLPVNGNVVDAVQLDTIINDLLAGVNNVDNTQLVAGSALANIGTNGLTTTYLALANLLTQVNWYSAKDYGALGNNVQDDAPKITAACTAATATGGVVWTGWGSFKLGSTISLPTNVQIWGSGTGATVFYPNAGVGTAFTFGTVGTNGQALKNFTIAHPSSHTDISVHIEESTLPVIDGLWITNAYNALDIGNDLNASAGNNTLRMLNTNVTCISTGSGLTLHRGGSAWFASNCNFNGTYPTTAPAATSYGMNVSTTYSLDTVQMVNCNFAGFYNNLYFGPSTTFIDGFFSNCIFDFSDGDCALLNPTSGSWAHNVFSNCYFHSNNTNGLTLNGGSASGTFYDNDFIGCTFPANGVYGVSVLGSRVRRTRFIGCQMAQNGTAGFYVGPGAGSDDGSGPIELNDCDAYTTSGTTYGVYLSSTALGVSIKGGRYGANTNPFYLGMGLNGCQANRIYIKDAEGFGGVAQLTSYGPIVAGATTNYGTVAVPTFSSGIFTNPFPSDMDVFITGGTVTGLFVGVSAGNQLTTNMVPPATINVPFNGVLRYAGSAAPTIACFLK